MGEGKAFKSQLAKFAGSFECPAPPNENGSSFGEAANKITTFSPPPPSSFETFT